MATEYISLDLGQCGIVDCVVVYSGHSGERGSRYEPPVPDEFDIESVTAHVGNARIDITHLVSCETIEKEIRNAIE